MDIPGKFLNGNQYPKEPKIFMVIQGGISELMENVAPNIYKKSITDSRVEKVRYVEV